MATSTTLEDKLEGIETFEHGSIGLVSSLERIILITTSRMESQNQKKMNLRRSAKNT